jgi:aspartate aminotransferase
MQFTDRVNNLSEEGAYKMLARAQELEVQGREIIHMEIGQPYEPTYKNIVNAGVEALKSGYTRYTPSAGIKSLRALIAKDAGERRGTTYLPEQVIVSPGAKPILFYPTLVVVSEGDEVIYPDPGFPSYEAVIEIAGGKPVPVPLSEEENFSFDLDEFDRLITDKTRMIILNSPSNPTGGVMPLSALEHIAEVAIRHDIWVLSDEIYTRMVFDGSAPTIATLPGMAERTIICDGFSKTYAMTGWRLGYGIMPLELAEKVGLLLNHTLGCTANFTQLAGIEALTGDQEQVEQVVAEYQKRRDVLVSGLNKIPGMHCLEPQATFYVFPNIKSFGHTSDWVAEYLIEEAGVAVLPGSAFGKNGEGYLRLCYANSMENIQAAIEMLSYAFLKIS